LLLLWDSGCRPLKDNLLGLYSYYNSEKAILQAILLNFIGFAPLRGGFFAEIKKLRQFSYFP
jgi:hypothetical protein